MDQGQSRMTIFFGFFFLDKQTQNQTRLNNNNNNNKYLSIKQVIKFMII